MTLTWKALYKDIRRLHRKLPPALKYLGNEYVKSEFRLHRTADMSHLPPFFKAWNQYRTELQQQINEGYKVPIGKKMDESVIDSLSPSQLGQLLELRKETKAQPK